MIFGIDLGTTNSLIGAGETMFTSLVSSNVDIKEHKQVPREYVSEDIVSSYKTSMSVGSEGALSVECSSIVLKDLADRAEQQTDIPVKDVVISVPAYFSTSQREAVYKAAEKVDLNVKCLINEPTAAALNVCKDLKDLIVVYDLGGGTFDITVIDSRMGNYAVIATDGKVLGGDDLDRALVDEAVKECKIPIRYRNSINLKKMKNLMRNAKETIQRTRSDVSVDLSDFGIQSPYTLTVDIYKSIVKDVFWETIVRTHYVINTNVPVSESPKIVFVGGSTSCPYLREMVLNELQLTEVTSDCEPDLIVAKGVAIYADMVEKGTAFSAVDDVTKRLCIEDKLGNSVTVIDTNAIVPAVGTIVCSNTDCSDKLKIKLYQEVIL